MVSVPVSSLASSSSVWSSEAASSFVFCFGCCFASSLSLYSPLPLLLSWSVFRSSSWSFLLFLSLPSESIFFSCGVGVTVWCVIKERAHLKTCLLWCWRFFQDGACLPALISPSPCVESFGFPGQFPLWVSLVIPFWGSWSLFFHFLSVSFRSQFSVTSNRDACA